jgi:hypothetical protein
MKLCTMKHIPYSKHMLKEYYALISETIIEVVDHITGTDFKAKFP